jgi:hypothetical protein
MDRWRGTSEHWTDYSGRSTSRVMAYPLDCGLVRWPSEVR